jgi:hypothetical protein
MRHAQSCLCYILLLLHPLQYACRTASGVTPLSHCSCSSTAFPVLLLLFIFTPLLLLLLLLFACLQESCFCQLACLQPLCRKRSASYRRQQTTITWKEMLTVMWWWMQVGVQDDQLLF